MPQGSSAVRPTKGLYPLPLPRDTNKLQCDTRHPCHCRTL